MPDNYRKYKHSLGHSQRGRCCTDPVQKLPTRQGQSRHGTSLNHLSLRVKANNQYKTQESWFSSKQPVMKGNDMQIWFRKSHCSSLQNHSDRGVQEQSAHDKGKRFFWYSNLSRARESRTGLKPHIMKQDLFPLVQCILLYLTEDLAECPAQAPEHSSPWEKACIPLTRFYYANWRRQGRKVWFSFVF